MHNIDSWLLIYQQERPRTLVFRRTSNASLASQEELVPHSFTYRNFQRKVVVFKISVYCLGLLMAHSSNVHDQNDEGFTPLLVAADNGHTDIIGLLLVYEGINASQNVYEGLNAQNCYEGINAFEKCV